MTFVEGARITATPQRRRMVLTRTNRFLYAAEHDKTLAIVAQAQRQSRWELRFIRRLSVRLPLSVSMISRKKNY